MARTGPRLTRRLPAVCVVAALAAGVPVAADRLSPPDLSPVQDVSRLVVDRDGRLLRAFTTGTDTWRLPVSADEVSPLYLRILLAYEDRRFHDHRGVDPAAVIRALGQNVASRRTVSGASTLTMQTARLLEPRPRTLAAKLIETARAFQLEARLSKRDILDAYLTLAPMGGNLEGVRAASLAWFGKEPRRLTAAEAALLVALPQSPSGIRPDRYPERARAARDKVLRVMAARGVLSAEEVETALAEAVPTARRPLPFLAPHLARSAVQPDDGARRIATTLDRDVQQALERLARSELDGLDPRATVAILAVHNATGEVRAHVGSGDFLDFERQGQVDMVRAVRSPGSALKPFLYGLGFDLGLIHPQTLVLDRPTRFGHYRPENFERFYMGEVSVALALQYSLNVPAVAVLDAVGPGRFDARLRAAGVTLRFDRGADAAGLPLALGGAGITLAELVGLYAGLAAGGEVRPLRWRDADAPPAEAHRLVSPVAAWYLARILEAAPPPDALVAGRRTRRGPEIAFKTGTSYGFRDAWAVGYDAEYTVGVWVGRPDGTPSPGRYGRNTAAPILFRAFDLLPQGGRGPALAGRPEHALDIRRNEDLPPNLRRLGGDPGRNATPATVTRVLRRPLAITFPPDGSTVEVDGARDGAETLPLAAEGGAPPFRWLVNGRPLVSDPFSRTAEWMPDGPGFVRITVVDAEGRTARAEARIQPR